MKRTLTFLSALLAISFLSLPVVAQEASKEQKRLDLAEVRELRKQAADDAGLGQELQERVLELYDEAIGSLEAAIGAAREAVKNDRERAGIARTVDALREQLGRPDPASEVALPEGATVEQARSALAQERSRLSADLANLRTLEQLSEEHAARRNDIAKRLGNLDQEIESLSVELLAATNSELHPELKHATQISLKARRERGLRTIEKLRSDLALLDARATLTPWQIDLAQRRIDQGEQAVAVLEAATRDLRRRDAARSLDRVRELCEEAAGKAEALTGVAADTRELAERLWGAEGVQVRSEKTASDLILTKRYQADLSRIVQITRRKFEAFGHRGSIARWWPEIPEDFPKPGEVKGIVRELQRRTPEAQHRLIRFEQQRSETRKLSARIHEDLVAELGEEEGRQLTPLARRLLGERRELLEELIRVYGSYSNRLIELETVTRQFVDEEVAVQEFLYSRLLWVRSVPKPLIPPPGTLVDTAGWFFSRSSWTGFFRTVWAALQDTPGRGAGLLVGFGLLFGLRRAMRRRMKRLAEQVADPATDSNRATLGALLYTLLLAAPLPLALYLLGIALQGAESSAFLYSAGRALPYVAWIAALLEVMRQFLAPSGLAEGHFGWPTRVTRSIHRGILGPEIVFLPLVFFAVQVAMAGMQLDSPAELQAHNNSLGRVVFIAGLVFIGLSLLGLFRPRRREETPRQSEVNAWLHRLYMYVYPAVFLSTFVPALLAALGYYITGFLLAYQMLRSLWLVLGVLILSGMLIRWREVRLRSAESAESTAGAPLPGAERQVRQLFRFAVILVAAIGLFNIWSDASPTLQIMKRIQVWPRVAMIETVDSDIKLSSATSGAATDSADGPSEGTADAPVKVPGMPAPQGETTASTAQESSSLTLWGVFEALLAILITVMLVKNLPGLLELTLSRRARLDTGARIALGTLIRYAIIIIGVSAAFSFLGISWSKIQWLAAALTFGLGFGLQEIVANFVSGLILLTERPVRVGDAVTVGNLQGRVSRIQIRATTITLWDRSEMIVPNKEFVTTKLVNWTLSDSGRRIEIPVRIAYGADLQEVKDILVETARQNPLVFKEPAPHALVLDFGDDAVKLELRYFVDFGNGLQTRDEVHVAVDRALRERGIRFPLPQLNLHLPAREGRGKRIIASEQLPPEDSDQTGSRS